MIWVPYVPPLASEVYEGLAAFRHMPIEMNTDEAYWGLLNWLWGRDRDFVIVEHDIVIHDQVLSQFDACPYGYCGFGYAYYFGLHYGMGCTRFRAEFCNLIPDAVERAGCWFNEQHPPKHWCGVGGFLSNILADEGHALHVHRPAVRHLGERDGYRAPTHGCQPLEVR